MKNILVIFIIQIITLVIMSIFFIHIPILELLNNSKWFLIIFWCMYIVVYIILPWAKKHKK